ncbi:hypothetical protein F0562_011382 [Nyssa sinensis]|uniref:Phospholipase A1 n=1 Tax=Nyssa sinensis TaxID=561372 RepID=A0A5J5A3H1_9ASTE|nr:hypothetical protein F0562_011382 [Nyssa sinensis]
MSTLNETQPKPAELLGSKDWEGLLNPIDLSLRKLILRCGDFCQSTYDAFNNDPNSKYRGSCLYGRNSFFNKVYLPSASDYQIVSFLFASAKIDGLEALFAQQEIQGAWDNSQSNWMGFIAVTTDDASKANGRREIYVAWRGTKLLVEGLADVDIVKVDARPLLAADDQSDVLFLNNPQVMNGHSLGAALAGLSAFDVAENATKDIPIAAFVFAMPKLGNEAFTKKIKAHQNLKILHVKNVHDSVPNLPPIGYETVGTEVLFDNTKPPSLKSSQSIAEAHDLETLLYTVAGWNGKDGNFELKVPRSLGLVNKNTGLIKTEYGYPETWWVEKNKGMVLDNGDWISAPPFQD